MDTSTAPAGTGTGTGGAPLLVNSQQARGGGGGRHGHGHGDVGPVIGVLAVIGVLGIIAGLIGRLCSGRTIMGYGHHIDVEAWLESKFSSCLDGHVPTAVNANPHPRFPHPHLITTFPTGAATATAAFRPPNRQRPQHVSVPTNITATSSHCDSDSVSNSDMSVDEVVQPPKHQQKLPLQRQAQSRDESSSLSDHHQELNNHHQWPHHPH